MKRKIIYGLSILLLLVVGGLTYLFTRPSKNDKQILDYIVVRVDDENAYPFQKTFPLGTELYKIAWEMKLQNGNISKKVGDDWLPIDSSEKIYEDIYIKAS